ncbi:hypothetical protein RHGRI_037799 [Rhododendron griersonianum]|uniref:DUF4283 domain-containing protein n=1 Tax=Rhododendron griersonianum TaxID=479676 RepID=A0AAV6HWH4_9ERIC|nr:hypothetical protein RHGRI_037799 [Rhododendron griersonianum]
MADFEFLDLEEGSGETGEVGNICLAGKVLGSKPFNASVVHNILTHAWKTRASFTVVPWNNNVFLFRFEDIEDRNSVLQEGPWSIMNNLLVLKPIQDGMGVAEIDFSRCPFWIQIHGLPIEKMTRANAEIIGNRFDKLLAFETSPDNILLARNFLRIRAEINTTLPIPKGFWLRRKTPENSELWISYKYEKLQDYWYSCGRLGHENKTCRFVPRVEGLNPSYCQDLRTGRAKRAAIPIEIISRGRGEFKYYVGEYAGKRKWARGWPETATPPMLILTWNCQGAGRPLTSQALGDMVRKNRPSILFLMETKNNKVKMETIRVKLGFDSGVYVDPEGLSGGLALWWMKEVEIDVDIVSKNFIHAVISEKASSSVWAATFIYGCPTRSGRVQVWDSIREIAYSERLPWLCMGDFNQVLSVEDKLGGVSPSQNLLSAFHEMISSCGLVDLEFKGPKFTWRNNRREDAFIMERIDMAFANADWREMHEHAMVLVEAAIGSDHNPLILNTTPTPNKVGKPFKFESFWVTDEECKRVVSD